MDVAPAPEVVEEVSAQVVVDQFTGELQHDYTRDWNFAKAREMRLDPVLSLSRRVAVSPILASTWTLEADDEWEWLRQLIEDQVMPIRARLLDTSACGLIDFGWKAYEKIFGFEEPDPDKYGEFAGQMPSVVTTLDRIRPLKNDHTWVRYNKWNGKFMGLSHEDQYCGQKLYIDAQHSLFINFDEEGLGEYGEADMKMALGPYDSWDDCNRSAKRYDRKMAGAFLVVKYKVGKTTYGGKKVDNSTIAADLIKSMQASGAVAIPCEQERMDGGANDWRELWQLEFLQSPSTANDYNARLMYLDKLKARSLKVTERSVFEGEFGTKADASAHGDAMLLMQHLRHVKIVELYNQHLVNQLCIANGGPRAEGAVKIVAHPLSDENRQLFLKIFEVMLSDPGKGLEMLEKIDGDEVMRSLEIPLSDNNELNMSPSINEADDWREELFNRTGVSIHPEAPQEASWWADDVEFSEGPHKYSTVMAMLPEGVAEHVFGLALQIDDADLVEPGLEEEPHVTVKYGLHTEDVEDVKRALKGSSPVKMRLLDVTCFYADGTEAATTPTDPYGRPSPWTPTREYSGSTEYDVVKINVYSECLRKLNAKIVGELPFTDYYPVYKPHVTIAYVKPGTGEKYAQKFGAQLDGMEIILRELVFSDKEHEYHTVPLDGDQTRTEAGVELGFCATGPGGGVDSSCGKGEGGGGKATTQMAGLTAKLAQLQAKNAAARKNVGNAQQSLNNLRSQLESHNAKKDEVRQLREKVRSAERKVKAMTKRLDD